MANYQTYRLSCNWHHWCSVRFENELTTLPRSTHSLFFFCTEDGLDPWQLQLRNELHTLYEDCFATRTSIVDIIQGLQMPLTFEEAGLEVAQMGRYICGWDEEAAKAHAAQVIQAAGAQSNLVHQDGSAHSAANNLVHQDGLQHTATYHWRVDAASLWRGSPDAQKVCGIARSLISVGFDLSEPICARNVNAIYQGLKFGDGQKRGLALRLAWCALRKICFQMQSEAKHQPNMQKIFLSLSKVPTIIPSDKDANDLQGTLIQQALRQNTKAVMTLPMNTIEWARLVIAASSPTCDAQPSEVLAAVNLEARANVAKKLLATWGNVLNGYKAKLDESALDMGPAAKRQRRGRRAPQRATALAVMQQSNQPDRDEADSLQIGSLRIAALKNILSYATPVSFRMMEQHLEFAGNYKYSALSDAVLASKTIWPGSHPPAENFPSEAVAAATRANVHYAQSMVPKQLTSQPLDYTMPLSNEEHEFLIQKAVHVFEDECLHLADLMLRAKVRPDITQFNLYRLISCSWLRSIKTCASADLTEADYQEVSNAICFGDALDSQVKAALVPHFPCLFHMAMLPDLKANMPEDAVPCHETLIEQAEKQVWCARLTEFKAKLEADQKLIKTVQCGSESLADHLDWLRHTKRLAEASKAEVLVKHFTDLFFPRFNVGLWEDMAGLYSLQLASVDLPRPGGVNPSAQATSYSLVILDFNVPNARDALVIKKLVAALGNLVKTMDIHKTLVFAFTATRPKEDSLQEDPLEDEAQLVKIMRAAGFKVTQRIRMALKPPNEDASSAGSWDFWQDGRTFFHYESFPEALEQNHWMRYSELCRTTRVSQTPVTAHLADMHHVVPVDSDEQDLNLASFQKNINERVRAAQRGPEVFKTVLEALCDRSKLCKAHEAWLQPWDVLNILDMHPHNGDKAMGVLAGTMNKSWPCIMRHFAVNLPSRRSNLSVDYTIKRVASHCSRKWMERELVLHNYTKQTDGTWHIQGVQPANLGVESDLDILKLKEIPGAFEAYQGLHKLDFKVCEVRSGEIIVSPAVVAEFSTSPPSIKGQFTALQEEMSATYQMSLKGLWKEPTSTPGPQPEETRPLLDPRPSNPTADDPPAESPTLKVFDSLEDLESKVKIISKTKAFDDRNVTVLEDDQGQFYLLSADGDCILHPGRRLGGVGSGKVQAGPPEDAVVQVQFQLPEADKTLIEVLLSNGTNADAEENEKKEKVKLGSLYMVVKELQKMNGGNDISITGHGKLEVSAGQLGMICMVCCITSRHLFCNYYLISFIVSLLSSFQCCCNQTCRRKTWLRSTSSQAGILVQC